VPFISEYFLYFLLSGSNKPFAIYVPSVFSGSDDSSCCVSEIVTSLYVNKGSSFLYDNVLSAFPLSSTVVEDLFTILKFLYQV